MTALRERSAPAARPTPDNPKIIDVAVEDLPLSRVACWCEDGLFVIRSLEYDVIAADEDPRTAVHKFVDTTVAYAQTLGNAEDATRDDVEMALMIMGRMAEIAARLAPAEKPRRRGGLLERARRHRGEQPSHGWQLRPAALN
jgi:hypothetical protein